MIFDNCLILAPDGVKLSRCGRKKMNWYLKKGLAELISEDPWIIRLLFEPNGRTCAEDPIMLAGKPNICVVCGSSENLTRHHVIPYSFIKHMELKYKVDIIRDILPLCRECHDKYEKKSEEKRQDLSEKMGIPINPVEGIEKTGKARKAANTLLHYRDHIPQDRIVLLEQWVKDFLEKDEISDADLEYILQHYPTRTTGSLNFSKCVAESVENYSEFAKEWRTHFVETMNPNYLPETWKVDRVTDTVWIPQRMLKRGC